MGILRTAAVAAIGVVAYRAWQRHKAGDWSVQSAPDGGGRTSPHGDPRSDDLPGSRSANTASSSSDDVVGLGGTQGPETGVGSSGPAAGQSSPGFGG